MTGLISTNAPLEPWTRKEAISFIRSQSMTESMRREMGVVRLYEYEVERIRDLLENTDLTQREIGERFGVGPKAISDIYIGRNHKQSAA